MSEYLNTPAGPVRRPRALLMLGDVALPFERMDVIHSGTHQAGTLSATLRATPGSDVGQWGWWLQQGVILLDVFAGFPDDPFSFTQDDLTRLCTIRVDQIRLDAASNLVSIDGRDLSAILIDRKTSGQFQNRTASQVAKQFADAAGLDAQIQATTTKIGTYYSHDYVQIQHEQTEWAMLVYLARKEGFDCHVLGRTLYFGKFTNPQRQSYLIQFDPAQDGRGFHSSNAARLSFERDLTLSRDVIVTIRSHDTKTGKAFTARAKATSGQAKAARSLVPILPASSGDAQNYVFVEHAMSPLAAQALALQRATEISQHELRMSADLPGDDLLYPWVPVEVQGTGTLLDATYYLSEVRRTITPNEFSMSIQAKNHPTGTEVALD